MRKSRWLVTQAVRSRDRSQTVTTPPPNYLLASGEPPLGDTRGRVIHVDHSQQSGKSARKTGI